MNSSLGLTKHLTRKKGTKIKKQNEQEEQKKRYIKISSKSYGSTFLYRFFYNVCTGYCWSNSTN